MPYRCDLDATDTRSGDNAGMSQPDTPPPSPSPSTHIPHLAKRSSLSKLGYAALALGAGAAGVWLERQQAKRPDDNASPLAAAHLQTLDGQAFDAQPFSNGQNLILNFWAPWCPPCVEELPLIDAQYGATPHKNFQLLAIALDDLDKVQRFWRAHQLSHLTPAVAGYAGMAWMQRLGNPAGQLPYTVLLGAKGAILQSHLGALKPPEIAALFARAERP